MPPLLYKVLQFFQSRKEGTGFIFPQGIHDILYEVKMHMVMAAILLFSPLRQPYEEGPSILLVLRPEHIALLFQAMGHDGEGTGGNSEGSGKLLHPHLTAVADHLE